MNEGAAEQRNEQPVAARRFEPQQAEAGIAAGRETFPDPHANQQHSDGSEKAAVCQVHAIQVKSGIFIMVKPSPAQSPLAM